MVHQQMLMPYKCHFSDKAEQQIPFIKTRNANAKLKVTKK